MTMPLRKVDDKESWIKKPEDTCRHPEHDPPNMIVLDPGAYEYTCPSCGKVTRFYVPQGPRMVCEK